MMKKLKTFIKSYFAELGLFVGILVGIAMSFFFVAFSPFFLIWYINDCSKRWFGGSPDV